jgi:hypothetical protein
VPRAPVLFANVAPTVSAGKGPNVTSLGASAGAGALTLRGGAGGGARMSCGGAGVATLRGGAVTLRDGCGAVLAPLVTFAGAVGAR